MTDQTPKQIIAEIMGRVVPRPGHNMLAHEIVKKLDAAGYVILPRCHKQKIEGGYECHACKSLWSNTLADTGYLPSPCRERMVVACGEPCATNCNRPDGIICPDDSCDRADGVLGEHGRDA